MEEVKWLLNRGLVRAGKPVIFLVDDLDRCSADYVVEFLETVQTQLRDALHSAAGATCWALCRRRGRWALDQDQL